MRSKLGMTGREMMSKRYENSLALSRANGPALVSCKQRHVAVKATVYMITEFP